MQRAIIFALLQVTALAVTCPSGKKLKKDVTGFCLTQKTDATSCAACCEPDTLKCGGIQTGFATPTANTYCGHDTDATTAEKDKWNNIATTEKTKYTDCCTTIAKCGAGGYTIPAGKKLLSTATNLNCGKGPKSCAGNAACFEADKTTCGGLDKLGTDANGATPSWGGPGYVACVQTKANNGFELANTFADSASDAWKRLAAGTDAATKGKSCCAAKATCGSKFYTCSAGQRKKKSTALGSTASDIETFSQTVCDTDAASCAKDDGNCCEKDTSSCGGLTLTCAADRYWPNTDFWKNKATTDANKLTDCCLRKATCSQGACGAGYKMKAGVEKLACPSDAASCASATANCCEADTAKCGGYKGTLTCAAGFYDKSAAADFDLAKNKAAKDAWMNQPATAATKNTACCTAKASCGAAVAGATTTPAATATPATPALKFSEHKVAVEEGSSNMVWLGAGAFIGMGVLMVVQGFRSRMPEVSARRLDNAAME